MHRDRLPTDGIISGATIAATNSQAIAVGLALPTDGIISGGATIAATDSKGIAVGLAQPTDGINLHLSILRLRSPKFPLIPLPRPWQASFRHMQGLEFLKSLK
jgi:hypothetical protein